MAENEKERKGRNRRGEWAIIVLFLAVLVMPFLGGVWRTLVHEIRTCRTGHMAPVGSTFLHYVRNDVLGNTWLRNLYSRLVVVGFSSSPNPALMVGRDGWLYLFWERESLPYYRRTRPFSQEDLHIWRKVLHNRREWFERRDIVYLMVVAPNKSAIYPQYMPKRITRADRPSRLDQFMANLADEDRKIVLDLRPALEKAAAERIAYFKTDSHWNPYGAYRAYLEIMKRLAELRPGEWAEPITEIAFLEVECEAGDLAAMLKSREVLRDVSYWADWKVKRKARKVVVARERLGTSQTGDRWPDGASPSATETDDPSLPRGVVIRDSFFSALMSYVPEHFSRCVYVWSANFMAQGQMRNAIDVKLIDIENPDIVIEQFTERYLNYDPPDPDIE